MPLQISPCIGAVERHLAGGHLVQHRAEREQVSACVHILRTHLLRPGGNKIVALLPFNKLLTLLPLLGILLLADMAVGQQSSTPLLTLQRSRAYLNLETNVVHGQGMNGITYGKGGDVSSYPNSLSCVLVYGDGKFVLEKREETTVGKPKTKTAEGSLSTDDLQHLKAILDDEALKKLVTPKAAR